MRIVSWNILQGGGRRIEGICNALRGWSPDIVLLQEVRQSSVQPMLDAFADLGMPEHFIAATENDSENTLFIAARRPIEAGDFMAERSGPCHILEAEVDGLTILPVHFPQKAAQIPLFNALLADSDSLLGLQSLLIGDLNCGLPFEDSTHRTFANAKYFHALKDAGWVDIFRKMHGAEARAFSWESPRTGRGFRYDHALASPELAKHVTRCSYDHDVRRDRLSDHSALIVELDLA